MIENHLIKKIKQHEGFRSKAYKCPMDKWTIGYGTNIEDGISEAEAELLLSFRLNQIISNLLEHKPIILRLPQEKQEVLFDMAYNLGVNGLLGFKNMWHALERFNYEEAAVQILDSRYAIQVKTRAEENARIMGGIS